MNFDFIEGLSEENINNLYEDILEKEDILASCTTLQDIYCERYRENVLKENYFSWNLSCDWYYFQIGKVWHENSSIYGLNVCRNYDTVYWFTVSCTDDE